jgi:hypothetical protein
MVTTPRHEPDLFRADRSAAVEGTSIPLGVDQEVLFADATWDFVRVLSRADDSGGGWRLLLSCGGIRTSPHMKAGTSSAPAVIGTSSGSCRQS